MPKNVKYNSHFHNDWLENFSWVERDAMNNTKAYCTLCDKSFSVAALGITALHMHAIGTKHLSRLPSPTQSTLNFHCVKNVQEMQCN